MKLPTWFSFARRLAVATRPAPGTFLTLAQSTIAVAAEGFDDVPEPRDRDIFSAARESLNDQLHEVINRNAEGIKHAALNLRRDTDDLLWLGINDPFAVKAGSYARMALELASARRHQYDPAQRADLVARAMTFTLRAEMLVGAAKRNHREHIEAALARQEQRLRRARTALLDSNAWEAA